MQQSSSPADRHHEFAPAKVNLTLRVLGRRPDGYHEIESLVGFADVGDELRLSPASALSLTVDGPTAAAAGDDAQNLVIKAARALSDRVPGLLAGHFELVKQLPVAAGLGGGSSDAAAALRLLARLNALSPDDPRLAEAAVATGADVPVCLRARACIMRGIGERLSPLVALPPMPAVLVNPGVAVPTRDVFAALAAGPVQDIPAGDEAVAGADVEALIATSGNDLEAPALKVQPVIAAVLDALRELPGCRLARMSGSGATCFALFATDAAAQAGARRLRTWNPDWWVRATALR